QGSVQRAGDRVRITAQLFDARSERQLWADHYDRDLKDIFAIQSEVALKIADALNATLSSGERARIEQKPTSNLAAYDLYLKGNTAAGDRTLTGIQQAVTEYQEAVNLDSTFAAAYAGLANAYSLLRTYGGHRHE